MCNYCNQHQDYSPSGLEALNDYLDQRFVSRCSAESFDGSLRGRDSSFGVHFMKRKLGLDVVTYTYDWGLVTDLARRNISRICSELQLDHVLVSADIKQKGSM